jgi:hypothetical protein
MVSMLLGQPGGPAVTETEPCAHLSGQEYEMTPPRGSTLSAPGRQVAVACSLLFLLIVLPRLILPAPVTTPDSNDYFRLANNLITSNCYGYDLEPNGTCKPFWGYQPPGYPIFLVALRLIGAPKPIHAVVTQTFVFALAGVYALWASFALHRSLRVLIFCGIILALSPMTVAWSRWVLTETLAGAGALWVFAEIFRSIANRYLRSLHLTLAVSAAMLMRWDQIWVLIPVAACAFYVLPPFNAARRIAIVASAAGLPMLAMVVRAALIGLPLLPPYIGDAPQGMIEFWRGATKNQNFTAGFQWPIWSRNYEGLAERLDYTSMVREFDTPRFRVLIRRIGALRSGTELPAEMDAELAELARSVKLGVFSKLRILAQRAVGLWFNRDNVTMSGWSGVQGAESAETIAHIYRVSLVVLAAAMLLFLTGQPLFVLACLVSYFVFRTGFLVYLAALETRYLVPMFPAIEVVLPMSLSALAKLQAAQKNGTTTSAKTSSAANDAPSCGLTAQMRNSNRAAEPAEAHRSA